MIKGLWFAGNSDSRRFFSGSFQVFVVTVCPDASGSILHVDNSDTILYTDANFTWRCSNENPAFSSLSHRGRNG